MTGAGTDLARDTRDLMALRALNMEMGARAVDWAWALIGADRGGDGLFGLAGQTAPFQWPEINRDFDAATRQMGLTGPADTPTAVRWLAHGHLSDLVANGPDDFRSLKLVSRLWFDHKLPDLERFYLLKHAIREVEATGTQRIWDGLTRDTWRGIVIDLARGWLKTHLVPDPLT